MRHHPLCGADHGSGSTHFREIKKQITIPLVADIHFDYRLAIAAMEDGRGQDPDQSGKYRQYRSVCSAVVDAAKERQYPDPGRASTAVLWKKTSWRNIMV